MLSVMEAMPLVDSFANFLLEMNDDPVFTLADLGEWAAEAGVGPNRYAEVIAGVTAIGFVQIKPGHRKAVRGFTASNFIYSDPSMKMHGGSGWENIAGFAGQKG